MITTLIFDLGGVILKHRQDLMPYLIGEVFHIGTHNSRDIWKRHKERLLTGELPSRDFLQQIQIETGSGVSVHTLLEHWKELYKKEASDVNDELLKLIDSLRKKYAIYAMTDTLDVHHEFNTERGIYEHFDGAYYSHLEGKSKSQGEATFLDMVEKFHLNAKDSVFIDDMEAYVQTAEHIGMHGILFTSNADFLTKYSEILQGTLGK